MSRTDRWRELATDPDPLARMMEIKRQRELVNTVMLGSYNGQPRFTDPQTATLVLGPPRSQKTAAHLIPAIWSHWGGCVSVSTKLDVAQATALGQAAKGEVMHFAPDGSPCPQGFTELRWSPITGAQDWGLAVRIADALVKSSNIAENKGENSVFFATLAASLIACVIHFAALIDEDMEFAVDLILGMDVGTVDRPGRLRRAVETLYETPGSQRASAVLKGIVDYDPRTRSNIFATTAVVLKVYELPGAIETTKNVNFDPVAAFTSDTPPTIYITSPAQTQELCAPLVVAFMAAVQKAIYDRARIEALTGRSYPPVLFAIDELALVPMPTLPAILADGGSNGILLLCAMQDLSQAKGKWEQADAFPTLFGNLVVIRGIRDKHTLDLLSALGGHEDVPRWEGTERHRDKWWKPKGFDRSLHYDRRPILPLDAISEGDPDDPDRALHFTPGGGWGYLWGQFYFRTPPWPWIFYRTAMCALKERSIRDRGLPLPELARGGDTRFIGPDLGRSFLRLTEIYEQEMAGG